MNSEFKHVFGPVPSRRLGRSLGVDLVPYKTCSYDCVYCQLGRTTKKTVARLEYVPLKAVLAELRRKLRQCRPDYITLSGSGEPTLYAPLGALISGIKKMTKIPVAVLTNGSLLWDADVQDALLRADLVVPSLDAGNAKLFENVNRPHPSITFDRMVAGLAAFRKKFKGAIWLEVFLLGGITGIREEAAKIAALARHIRPDRVQLNTVTRPPAEDFAFPVSAAQMKIFRRLFGRNAEVIAEFRPKTVGGTVKVDEGEVMALLNRRPCTIQDIAAGLGLHPTQVAKAIEHLRDSGVVGAQRIENRIYYEPAQGGSAAPARRMKGETQVRRRKQTG